MGDAVFAVSKILPLLRTGEDLLVRLDYHWRLAVILSLFETNAFFALVFVLRLWLAGYGERVVKRGGGLTALGPVINLARSFGLDGGKEDFVAA